MKRFFVRVNLVVSDEAGPETTAQLYYEVHTHGGEAEKTREVVHEMRRVLDPLLESMGMRKRTQVDKPDDGSNGLNGHG